jgi:hypothetical protein
MARQPAMFVGGAAHRAFVVFVLATAAGDLPRH